MNDSKRKIAVNIHLILFLFLLQIIICQSINSQWYIQTTREEFNSITFFNENTGVAVGSLGLILRTTNAGNDWRFNTSLGSFSFNSITHASNLVGWATGTNYTSTGYIYKTTNAGLNWQLQYSTPQFNGFVLNKIQFVNLQTGWAIGNKGKVLKTTNGGINWIVFTVAPGTDSHTSIFMFDALTGWMTSSTETLAKKIFKTNDGGINWTLSSSDTGQVYRKILFSDIRNGWILEDPWAILRTSNSGQNWSRTYHGIPGSTYSMFFIDSLKGWIVNSRGEIYKSTNGGTNWYEQKPVEGYWSEGNVLRDIYFINQETGWATGGKSRIFRTTNGGNNWEKAFNTVVGKINSVKFINNNTGWVVSSSGNISKTINGGYTWMSQFSSVSSSLNALDFFDEFNGVVAGASGVILRTTNSGLNWAQVNSNTVSIFSSIDLQPNGEGFVSGNSGLILKTSNYGQNWVILSSGTNNNLKSINITIGNNAWVVGDSVVLKTTDGGNSWITKIADTYLYSSVHFINTQTGWLTCTEQISSPPFYYLTRRVFKTTNDGISWDAIYSQNTQNSSFNSVYFTDSLNGWVVSRTGEILRTYDGGSSFSLSNAPLYRSLNSVFALSPQYAWIAGDTGTVFSTYSGNPIGIIPNNSETPVSYNMYQNYPNPFNPTTKITFALPFKSFITLKVYDLLGKEIETLVNTSLDVGKYDVVFDASNLASGIYFYRIESEHFSETKKMIVLK